ncbi:MAG: CopG family transcriptional regulator [Longimicrobiales bacterium]
MPLTEPTPEANQATRPALDPGLRTIYGNHMESIKTTVYLPAAEYRRLQALARAEGRSTAELIREAVAEYAGRRAGQKRPRSLGAFRSGRKTIAEKAEHLLEGLGET